MQLMTIILINEYKITLYRFGGFGAVYTEIIKRDLLPSKLGF